MSGDWSSSICACFDDCGICVVVWLLPCYQMAQNKADADFRECHCCDSMHCSTTAIYYNRTQIKAKYGIAQDPCNDCCISTFCGHCAVCQQARHMKVNKQDEVTYDHH